MKSIPELIKAIEVHRNLDLNCNGCPYNDPKRGRCIDKLLEDTLALLRSITQKFDDDRK